MLIDGQEKFDLTEIKEEIQKFYKELYSRQDNCSDEDMDLYLSNINKDVTESDNKALTRLN
jgi:hypothetical protein